MKESCCLSSRLNLASLSAEKAAISKGKSLRTWDCVPKTQYSITEGRTPKLTTSDRESSSFPTSEYAFRSLADKPSQKSKTAARSISTNAVSSFPSKENITPRTPQRRFMEVILLGICFLRVIT